MQVREIMTKDVVTVAPNARVGEVASIMAERRISGVPVVDGQGRLLGIVSETDLLHRTELGTERKRKAWLAAFTDRDTLAEEFVKSHGLLASEVMTRHVVTVKDDAELGEVAELLERNNIKRVPVTSNGKLVGLVTRGDLVRALAKRATATAGKLEDNALQKAMFEKVRATPWLNASFLNFSVTGGKVEMWGFVETAKQREGLRVLAEEMAGVDNVVDNVTVGLKASGVGFT
jgi:CBS domain-containing protein